jgi:hypothetical protein
MPSLPGTDYSRRLGAFGMDDDKILAVDHAQRNQPSLTVVFPVIDPRNDRVLEDQKRMGNIDAVLDDVRSPLTLIPFEQPHRTRPAESIDQSEVYIKSIYFKFEASRRDNSRSGQASFF